MTTVNEDRPRSRRTIGLVAIAAITACVVSYIIVSDHEQFGESPQSSAAFADKDRDGLPDEAEVLGWRAKSGERFVTSPDDPDSDGDGLVDGIEAGEKFVDSRSKEATYRTISSPIVKDTDGDGVNDGDEFFLGLNPSEKDSDTDGLLDAAELECDSDPTVDNVDDDNYSDEQECARGSDPMSYDIDRSQAIQATLVGFSAGDSEFLAKKAGRLNDDQFQSPEYLAGHLASGYVGIGDVRDIVANLGRLDFLPALMSAVALAPAAGDSAQTARLLTQFASRGQRAGRAADSVISSLPLSKARKTALRRRVFGSTPRMPTPSSRQGTQRALTSSTQARIQTAQLCTSAWPRIST